MDNDSPKFEHDCEACVFLGHYMDHDLYVHPTDSKTVIARYGSKGDYASGLCFANGRHSPIRNLLTEAKERAQMLGYLKDL